jgi:uncharacterized protein DUF4190
MHLAVAERQDTALTSAMMVPISSTDDPPQQEYFEQEIARIRRSVALPSLYFVGFAILTFCSNMIIATPAGLRVVAVAVVGAIVAVFTWRARLGKCPRCGALYFWKNGVWNLFHDHCPTCGLCVARPPLIAVAAGYLGLFSLLVIPAPVAVGISVVALYRLKAEHNPRGRGRAWFGLIMGSIVTFLTSIALCRSFLFR